MAATFPLKGTPGPVTVLTVADSTGKQTEPLHLPPQ